MKKIIVFLMVTIFIIGCSTDDDNNENKIDINQALRIKTKKVYLADTLESIYNYTYNESNKLIKVNYTKKSFNGYEYLETYSYSDSKISINESIIKSETELLMSKKEFLIVGNNTSKILHYKNVNNTNFTKVKEEQFLYNGGNKLQTHTIIDIENGFFNPSNKYEYDYNEIGDLIKLTGYDYLNKEWIKSSEKVYSYSNDKIDEIIYSFRNQENIEKVVKYKYLFDESNKFEKLELYTKAGESWSKESTCEANYDTNTKFTHFTGCSEYYQFEYEDGTCNLNLFYFLDKPKLKGLPANCFLY